MRVVVKPDNRLVPLRVLNASNSPIELAAELVNNVTLSHHLMPYSSMVRASVRLSEGYVVQFPLGLRNFLSIGLIRIHTKSHIPQATTTTHIYRNAVLNKNINKTCRDLQLAVHHVTHRTSK